MKSVFSKISLLLLVLSLLFVQGCAIQHAVVRSAVDPIIDGSFEALMAEDDLILAKSSIESSLKLVEGMILSDPGNDKLLLVAAQGFTAYALAFVEDENPERAAELYLRGRKYANKWLIKNYKTDLLSVNNLEDFKNTVSDLPDKAMP